MPADDSKSLETLLGAIQGAEAPLGLMGLEGSAPAYLVSRLLARKAPPLTVYVVPTTKDLEQIASELEFYGCAAAVHRFPPLDTLPYFQVSPHRDVQAQRIKTLIALLHEPGPQVVVTSASALASYVLPPERLRDKQQLLKPGDTSDRDILVQYLLDWGYQQTPLVEDRGTYAVRGGIVDLWGPLDNTPWRIELFGDEIESIRRFDPKKQTSLETLPQVTLVPVRELLWDEELREELAAAFVKRADEIGLKATEKRDGASKLRSGMLFGGVEQLLSLLGTSYLPAYFPAGTQYIFSDGAAIKEHLEELKTELNTVYEHSESLERVVKPDEVINESMIEPVDGASLYIGGVSDEGRPSLHAAVEANEDLRWTIRKAADAPLQELAGQLTKWQEECRLVIVASTTAQRRRLLDLFAPYELSLVARDSDFNTTIQQGRTGEIPVVLGELTRGFRWPDERLIIVTDEEIFGPKAHKRVRGPASQERFLSFGELKEGDPLVHEENGIGRYLGMTRLDFEGVGNDFLVLEYAQGDKLYVPVYRMNQVTPYTGGAKVPRLDKLGGASWHKVREKAQKAIRQMAGELLNLYAVRAAGVGHAFAPANEIFEAFEASFPYEETEDQDRTIEEVIADMEKPQPMDRLVLGDVGYGKTEVAMRAAFKAALENKQTAVLVPTTVLAFQHYRSFVERFNQYPVKLGILSRFQNRKEIQATLAQLATGEIDIVIGTHRLLQNDINMPNLGLLVIDEEHRFGVTQKEKIKQFKKSVDVLALSATPIPRTLNMAMSGLRGISVIETPPTDRLSIRTYVTPDSDATIQEAVEREVRRGGQVFFVHNRVMDIQNTAQRLKRILPDIRIGVAHGQMKEQELEAAMIAFANHEYDLLLCTTIIESGIDIPTANTILIERADQFGLAQIYQLRGRVGRGAQRAYAYLLISSRAEMTADAKKRLAVLKRFSELGSGFKMACHDLEIRGAGNVLGDKQSGHLEAIGYDLYVELLEQAIKELKGEVFEEVIEPELHLRVPAGIPEDYIRDPALRLDMYRRLAAMRSFDEAYQYEEELVDRFGPLPSETENLLKLMQVKVLAKQLRLRAVHYSHKQFVYSFDASTPLSPDVIMERVQQDPDKYRLTPDMKLVVQGEAENDSERLKAPQYFLQSLLPHVNVS